MGPLEAVSDRLKAELGAFGQCFNVRLSYFKNLQGISDSVKDPDMESSRWRGLLIELEDLRLQESELLDSLVFRLIVDLLCLSTDQPRTLPFRR